MCTVYASRRPFLTAFFVVVILNDRVLSSLTEAQGEEMGLGQLPLWNANDD
ncbi:hypothetical protein [Desulfosporosinus fructosivorans]|uniref:hypothetical protein n=1 Tax=Desulfosporosinus fructosivorans TaxID=2018669 RepID=UPI00130DD488|nr:hypothetical protein [Desulfosporosinus fructosivorans]